MRITEIRSFLVDAAPEQIGGWERRNWLFVEVHTDAGIHGVGEASGWPRVVQTAIADLTPLLVGADPRHIERLWCKMFNAMMGHGMTGIVGSGAITGIEMALWDIKGKALGVPVWDLLGGKIRDVVPAYAHARSAQAARVLVDRGYDAIKTGGIKNCVQLVDEIRTEVGPDVDVMVDLHGPPWMSAADAVSLGRRLEQYDLLFYEDPVAPENVDALRRVSEEVAIPIAAGERHPYLWGVRELIEEGIIDVVQPDTGRFGGLSQMKKLAGLAEAHYVSVAPHDGSLGPVAEVAAIHFLASIPNCLILEHLDADVKQRGEVMRGAPPVVEGAFPVPDAPGLGIELVHEVIERYPSRGNVSEPEASFNYQYVRPRRGRSTWLSTARTDDPGYLPGSIY